MPEINPPEDPNVVQARKDDPNPLVMYIIVREELEMTAGKLGAQIGHAAQMILLDYRDRSDHEESHQRLSSRVSLFTDWLNTSFRKIVKAADEKEWKKVQEAVDYYVVRDAGLTEVEPNTETVMVLWPMRRNDTPKVVSKLQNLK